MKLFKHQEEAVNFVVSRGGSGAVFHEMGLGKTRTGIEIFKRLRAEKDPSLRLLVLAPLSLLEAAWMNDFNKFAPEFSVHNCHDKGFPKNRADVLIFNYESAITSKNVLQISSLVSSGPWMVICDESSRMKNAATATTKTLLKMVNLFRYRIVMTGTPAPNSETEYYGQIEFVKPGILGGRFSIYRNSFFHLEGKDGRPIVLQGGYIDRKMMSNIYKSGGHYSMLPHKRKQLMERIAPLCHWAKKAECLDLPDQVEEVRFVKLGDLQRKAYQDLKNHLIAEIQGHEITAQAALEKIMKLREITSGFAINALGESKEVSGENPKLNELLNVIEELGNQQVIIWGNFSWEIRKIRETLSRLGRVVTLYGETENRNESIRDFISGHARFLVANPKSAAHGLTLVNCSTQIFFSHNYSHEMHVQSRDRIHRFGQTKSCLYIYLVAKDTIDEDILNVLSKKQRMQDVLYRMIPRKFQEAEMQEAG